MKLNRKGYMLIELILSSVLAMTIAYYLLNLTYKFKDKNEDVYNSTYLVTDKILITKNIMNDLEGKIIEFQRLDNNKITFTADGENRKITIDNKSINYTDGNNRIIYSKTLENSMEIGNISFENNIVTIPITNIYTSEPTYIKIPIKIKDNTSKMFYYTGNYQEYKAPMNGYYKIELWGAQGGSNSKDNPGGKGGYTSGIIKLKKDEILYVYVGNSGYRPDNLSKPFNGGGAPDINGAWSNSHTGDYSGGGATDIRIISGAWDDSTSLNSRIMVAGGGGGGSKSSGTPGGVGGNLIGGTTKNGNDPTQTVDTATQTKGFSIGTGQASGIYDTDGGASTGAGGGGYYGGYRGLSYSCGGSGGSSFISGYAGVNAKSKNESNSNNTKHYSGKYFIDGIMKAGEREGDGQAKITYISSTTPTRNNTKLNNVRYIKDCINKNSINNYNHWTEIQAIYDGTNVAKEKSITGDPGTQNNNYPFTNIVDGIIDLKDNFGATGEGKKCVKIDLSKNFDLDEIAVWHYYADGRSYKENITSVSSNGTTWTEIINDAGKKIIETETGKRVSAYR